MPGFAAYLLPITIALAPPAFAADDLTERYNQARDQYEIGEYQASFAAFAALADAGHCDAVRMSLQMLRYGRSLYFTEFRVPLERVQQWQHQADCATLDRRLARRR